MRIRVFVVFFLIVSLSFADKCRSRSSSCPVAFRVDDIQDFFLRDIQLMILSYFINENLPVTLGLISGHIGSDAELIVTLSQGYEAGLFELAYHGFGNENLSQLSYDEQKNLVKSGTDNLKSLFEDIKLVTFIPPMFEFDQNTSQVCLEFDFKIISSSVHPIARADRPSFVTPIIHLPETVDSANYSEGVFHEVPSNITFKEIQESVDKYGYAIVTLHPQQFSILDKHFNHIGINQTRFANFKGIVNKVGNKFQLSTIAQIKDVICQTENPNISTLLVLTLPLGFILVIGIIVIIKYRKKLYLVL